MTATDAKEIYDELLLLSNKVGAAYVDVCEKTRSGIDDFQHELAGGVLPDDDSGGLQAGVTSGEALEKARERASEISEKLREMNRKVALLYLNACELAALAVADCQEELAANSRLELVKAVGEARAGLAREVTKAYASAAREIVR